MSFKAAGLWVNRVGCAHDGVLYPAPNKARPHDLQPTGWAGSPAPDSSSTTAPNCSALVFGYPSRKAELEVGQMSYCQSALTHLNGTQPGVEILWMATCDHEELKK